MKVIINFFLCLLILMISYPLFAQDNIKADARSRSTSIIYPDAIFRFGDSCSVVNPERHDGYQHANGYPTYADSMKYVIKMTPSQYPWVYTNVCIGFTSFGSPTWTYYIVMYDSTPTGPGTNLLYISSAHTAANVPVFPLMGWYSSQDTLPVITSGAVYLGIRFQSTGVSEYISIDESPSTPLWPGYLSTNSGTPSWSTVQSHYASYKCCAVRTEGMSLVGIHKNNNEVPEKFSLSQNYPNPFNPNTEIQYQVSEASIVKIVVFDYLGREVMKLVNEFQQAGTYKVSFNGENFPSGVYLCKMTAGDFIASRKMLLVK